MAQGMYPRWIYRKDKEGNLVDARIVQNAYEHSTYYQQGGYTEAPIYGDDIATLRKEVQKDEAELAAKKKRLATMEQEQKEAEDRVKKVVQAPSPSTGNKK